MGYNIYYFYNEKSKNQVEKNKIQKNIINGYTNINIKKYY